MKKIGIVIVVLALIWAVTPLRTRFLLAIAPALARMGPVGERLSAPIHAISANSELTQIQHELRNDRNAARPLPADAEFREWVARRSTYERDGLDPWGMEYYLVPGDATVTVGSNGPDRQRDTEDDIKQTTSY